MKKRVPPPPPPPKPAAAEISTADVLRYQLKEQQGKTLRTAEQLLQELDGLVKRLREGTFPTATLNPSILSFLIADHARLLTLKDTLDLIEKP